MNERIKQLEDQCSVKVPCDFDMRKGGLSTINTVFDRKKFAELIVRECINTLEFHGFDDAVPYIKWMATNKLGVKE